MITETREGAKERERVFFNERYREHKGLPVDKYRSVTGSLVRRYEDLLFSLRPNSVALDYGCGPCADALKLARAGVRVVAIDIADAGMKLVRSLAAEGGSVENLVFSVADCEKLCFADDSFDVVYGNAILHHLKVERALEEMARVLRPAGKAFFIEPLGHNPLINLYRKATPQYRTADEHPLKRQDLSLIEERFHRVDCRFFNLLSLAAVPLRKTRLFLPTLRTLEFVESKLFDWTPRLRLQAWLVLIICEQPRKQPRPRAVCLPSVRAVQQ